MRYNPNQRRRWTSPAVRREAVLAYVNEHRDEYGYSPSVRDIAQKMNVSVSTAHGDLRELEEEGLVTRVNRLGRSVVPNPSQEPRQKIERGPSGRSSTSSSTPRAGSGRYDLRRSSFRYLMRPEIYNELADVIEVPHHASDG